MTEPVPAESQLSPSPGGDGITTDQAGNVPIQAPAAIAIVEIPTDSDPED